MTCKLESSEYTNHDYKIGGEYAQDEVGAFKDKLVKNLKWFLINGR